MSDHDEDDGFGVRATGLAVGAVRARLSERFVSADDLLVSVGGQDDDRLREPGACFVTLRRDGRLRGCIGTVAPSYSLYRNIVHYARLSMVDKRMAPVTIDEWPGLSVEVSVLSASASIPAADRTELETALRPGMDGLTLRHDDRRATFLPSVWTSLPTPEAFVTALLHKGGWREWPPGMTAERYTTTGYTDHPPRPDMEQP